MEPVLKDTVSSHCLLVSVSSSKKKKVKIMPNLMNYCQ